MLLSSIGKKSKKEWRVRNVEKAQGWNIKVSEKNGVRLKGNEGLRGEGIAKAVKVWRWWQR
jgi:hypothetical protein